MNTMQFIARHNASSASLEIVQARAKSNYRQSIRSLEYANRARAEGDYITGKWYDAESEKYADKSDECFAAYLQAARGLK